MQNREIERNPLPPSFNKEAIELLTKLCFLPDNKLERSDLIFGFSAMTDIEKFAQSIKNLAAQKWADKVFIAGGAPKFIDSSKITKAESEIALEIIGPGSLPDTKFYIETKSTSTLENVTEALKVLDFSKFEKIIYVFKKHDSRRGYLTFRKFLPKAKLIQHTFEPTYPGTGKPLNQETWHTYEFGRGRVWGEYLRIKLYGERGDIAYDEETKHLVDEINKIFPQ